MVMFKRIVVRMDFNEPALAALGYARAIAQSIGGSESVIHVIPAVASEVYAYSTEMVENWERSAYQRLKELMPAAERSTIEGRFEARVGAPVEEILNFAAEQKADLIVLGTHSRGAVGHLFLGSVAEPVVRRASCPVLTIGPAAARAAKPAETDVAVSG